MTFVLLITYDTIGEYPNDGENIRKISMNMFSELPTYDEINTITKNECMGYFIKDSDSIVINTIFHKYLATHWSKGGFNFRLVVYKNPSYQQIKEFLENGQDSWSNPMSTNKFIDYDAINDDNISIVGYDSDIDNSFYDDEPDSIS